MGEGGIDLPRILGDHTTGRPGPTIVITGGIHGNEPSGAVVARDVIAHVAAANLPLRGRILGVAGNRAGLAANVRARERDLNRGWHDDALLEIAHRSPTERAVEDQEQLALLRVFQQVIDDADGPVVFLDLHSTSGEGAPFAAMADVLRNRPIAFALPLPVVLGLEEAIDGTMLGYLCDLGHVGVAVEGGQHDASTTRAHHEAVAWITLVAAGALRSEEVPDLSIHRKNVERATRSLPRILEIRHRHQIEDGDDYEMGSGFENFSPVTADQVVATDRHGPVRAPEAGRMMLPRYQRSGDDGYFLARPVKPRWLRLSAVLRRLRLQWLVLLLPGVSRHPERPDHLVVAPPRPLGQRHARNLFHLFGYRRATKVGEETGVAFTRRRPDALGPRNLPPALAAALREAGVPSPDRER